MKKKLDKELLQAVRDKLEDFEGTDAYDTRELEASMEVLATQIYKLMADEGEDEPTSLADAVEMLPIGRKATRQLIEICTEIQEVLDATDYDSGDDEDDEDIIGDLKADFYWILDPELKKLIEAK